MRPLLGLTQRCTIAPGTGELRDGLARDWTRFLHVVGAKWIALPNDPTVAVELAEALGVTGIVFTGGDDIGVIPERDATEKALFTWSCSNCAPVLGVCRGFQMLHHIHGGALIPVAPERHVAKRHTVLFIESGEREVNSFHRLSPDFQGMDDTFALHVLGRCKSDGMVEMAAGNQQLGIMWHPERESDFAATDIELFRSFFAL